MRTVGIAVASALLLCTSNLAGQDQTQPGAPAPAGATTAIKKKTLPQQTPAAPGTPKPGNPSAPANPKLPGAPKKTTPPTAKPVVKKQLTTETPKAEPASKWVSLSGDFRAVRTDPRASECRRPAPMLSAPRSPAQESSAQEQPSCDMDACAVLLAQDGSTETGKVSCLSVSDDSVSLKYTPNSASAAAPAFLLVGKRNPPDHRYSIPSENVQTFKQAITGDFCQKDENCNCTTAMLRPEAAPGNQCASFPRGRSVADWERRGRRRLSATVSDASGAFHSATVESLDVDTAVVTFTAPTDFKPASMLLTMRGDGANPGGAYSFAYAPQQPLQVSNLN